MHFIRIFGDEVFPAGILFFLRWLVGLEIVTHSGGKPVGRIKLRKHERYGHVEKTL